MTRKFLMITTAIVALSAASVVQAQSTNGKNSTASAANAKPLSTNQMPASPAPNAQVQASGRQMSTTGQMMSTSQAAPQDQAMSSKGKMKSAKMTHKAGAKVDHRSKAYREMNAREVQATRELNRQGGQPQAAMAPMNGGMSPPAQLGGQINTTGASSSN
jgi:hypothetical protein